jgi:glycosyltransferase involved in cell wall biosynthesis
MPICSVVVRVYNEEKHIGRLLAGILQQTVEDVEVIVVDSGSTDATLAIASRFPVRVLSIKPEEFTFGRSLNLGCAQARGDYIVIASGHVYPVYPDWLEQLLAPFADPKVALVYGRQRGNRKTRFSEHQIFAKWFPETSNPRQDHPFCNNANAAIRRELWQERPYNEKLTGLEDLDWAAWALSKGYYLAYSAEAEVVHVHEESARQIFNRYRREAIALKSIRPEARFHWWDFLRFYAANVASDSWYALRQGVLAREWRGILAFRLLQFWGTYRGFAYRGEVTSQLRRTFYYPRGIRTVGRTSRRPVQPIEYASLSDPDAPPLASPARRDGEG